MPEVRYETIVPVAREELWAFVENIDNWAPMMTGYVSHTLETDRRSIWTLKGDVGILSRTVRLQVDITEWQGPDRVSFTLTGLNEAVSGGGAFELSDAEEAVPSTTLVPEPAPRGLLRRLIDWIVRTLFQRTQGAIPAASEATVGTRLGFTWRMEAGGATAPLVNAMLEPALEPAAESLAHRIAAHFTTEAA